MQASYKLQKQKRDFIRCRMRELYLNGIRDGDNSLYRVEVLEHVNYPLFLSV